MTRASRRHQHSDLRRDHFWRPPPGSTRAFEASGGGHCALGDPWPCLYEFLRVVTHSRVFHPPVPAAVALADLQSILTAPSVVLLSETERHFEVLDAVMRQSSASGNLVHDAHIAALCLEHGVTELLTADRDFVRFTDLRTINPFDRSVPLMPSN